MFFCMFVVIYVCILFFIQVVNKPIVIIILAIIKVDIKITIALVYKNFENIK